MDLSEMPWKDILTVGAASLGAGLGIMNTWNAISQRKVRLRVKPQYAIGVPNGHVMFSIEVVNLGTFAVTIREVGSALDGRSASRGKRAAIAMPIVIDGKSWPRRLEARESVSAYFDPGDLASTREALGKAYAHTSCGEFRYGDSPARKQLRDELRA